MRDTVKRRVLLGLAAATLLAPCIARAAWPAGQRFRVEQVNGKPCIVDPTGAPFKSVGLVWAYGPERGSLAHRVDLEKLTNHLQRIKDLGFNTLNLYGDQMIPEMLAWCDEHELAVYYRTSYYSLPDFPGELKQYPDFMDASFREKAKGYYKGFIAQIKDHPSVLAVDMDNRWLFPLDWAGAVRFAEPMLREHALKALPAWLEREYGGDLAALNAAWGTDYASYDDVLRDQDVIRGGKVLPLENHPWRADIIRYTVWTQADFLGELAMHLKAEANGVIVTPTTEHPECIPDTNPGPATGIDFMSPVHYNQQWDFDRDLAAIAKLIYETRWHYDFQGGPPYISETGWRTGTLEQNPPVKSYAWTVPPDEEVAARCYAVQFSLLQVLPWVSGYGYFMMYDKVREGDFGYLRDDGTKKPQALVGDAINGAFNVPDLADPEPQVWIYYPEYAQASHRPGFQQFKTFVAAWERDFLASLDARIEGSWKGLRAGDREAGKAFAGEVVADFKSQWRGFAFAKTIPADDKPVLLFSTVSEILSAADRAALLGKKTVCFGSVGKFDLSMRETPEWNDAALNLAEDWRDERRTGVDLAKGGVLKHRSFWSWLPWVKTPEFSWENAKSGPVTCKGQAIQLPGGNFRQLELVAGAKDGNAAAFCEIEYKDGGVQRAVLGPTISDVRFQPVMTPGLDDGDEHYSMLAITLEPQRPLKALRLPDDARIQIVGAALVEGGVARDAIVDFGGGVKGLTPYLAMLETDKAGRPKANPRADVLERFANGAPAVVAYGKNVTFLYDPLTWSGKAEDFSRQVDAIAASIDKALEHLEDK